MRFTPQFLDELKARLPVSEVVGKRVQLKRAGREWKGLSPFQKEKSASFFVNDEKGFYHDFSSGKHGSIFDFVMETEGVTFPEAVERLASMAGLAVPTASPEDTRREERRKTLHDVMELAAKFFSETLASKLGAKARGYLADRGLDAAAQLKFRIGYAPNDRFALKEHLGARGVSVEDMIEARLLSSGEEIAVPYDRFRDRVMFPICDARNRVIAFGGRAMEKDAQAKYLNSADGVLFHKGDTLYNIAPARTAAHNGATLIAVEGYVDVISMVMAGFEATVAPLGTALTENQLALLWKMADEPVLCFDGDGAGKRAAYRAADIALPLLQPGKSLRVALLPEGQDPDDLARAGGKAAIDEVIGAARPLVEIIWTRELEGGAPSTPERRAALEARLSTLTQSIQNEVVRKYYRAELQQRLRDAFAPSPAAYGNSNAAYGHSAYGNAPYGQPRRNPDPRFGVRDTGNRGGQRSSFGNQTFGKPGFSPPPLRSGARQPYQAMSPQMAQSPLMRGQRAAWPRREALILQCLLNHPWLMHEHLEDIAELALTHTDAAKLRDAIVGEFSHSGPTDDPAAEAARLAARLDATGFREILQRLERAITTGAVWAARPGAAGEDVLATWRQLVSLHRQWNSLTRELKDAEAALGQDPSEQHYAWLRDVKSRLEAMDGTEALIEGFGELSGRTRSGT